ncbi:unnamed protein product, partial [Rotaria sp. Silwood1]
MISTLKAINETQKNNQPKPLHSTNEEIAKIALDFIFAAQDASTSSLTFTIHELCKHPNVFEKIRQEQKIVRPDSLTSITPELLTQMKYTWQVMKELLRPPATIALHLAKKTCFSDPEKFDPERFNSERMEQIKFDKNFLTFGAGPHSCLGQRYAMNHIMLFISLLIDMDFERANRPNKDKIMY